MKTTLKTFVLLAFCITAGCTGQTKKSNQVTQINEEKMKKDPNCPVINDISFEGKEDFLKYIENERVLAFEEDPDRDIGVRILFTEESTPFVFPILSYWLNKKGYKTVSSEVFNNKLKNIFKIDRSIKHEKIFFGEDYIRYNTAQGGESGELLSYYEFIFSTKYNLFFRPLYDEYDGRLIEEIGKTQRYQSCFPEKLYHYNNFLFNDSKASLRWLINNDMNFLELLVKAFGYEKEPKINQAVLEKINKDYLSTQPYDDEKLNDLFAKKDCYGNLQIREGLMKYILENTTVEDCKLVNMLQEYATYIGYLPPEKSEFTQAKNWEI